MSLGALIRERRGRETQIHLAERAGVSEATIIRIEKGRLSRPNPSKLARLLVAVGIDEEELRATEAYDADWRDEVAYFMRGQVAAVELGQYAASRRPAASVDVTAAPDLLLVHPSGAVVALSLKASGSANERDLVDELARATRALGYTVMAPTSPPAGG